MIQIITDFPLASKARAGGRIIKMVTLNFRGAPPKKMTASIYQNDEMTEKMLSFKKKLIDQSRKGKWRD